MLEWYLQLNISTTHPCQRRQENWSENHKRFNRHYGKVVQSIQKPKITTYNISHNATSFMPKGVSECVTGSSSCTLLCPCLANCSKLGDFPSQFTEKPPSWQNWMDVLPWENHTKFLIQQIQRPLTTYHGHKIIHFCLIATLKTPSQKVHKSMKRVHCFGFPTHLIGKINIFQLSYQFSLSRSCPRDMLVMLPMWRLIVAGHFFSKKIWKVPKDIPDWQTNTYLVQDFSKIP